MSMMRCETSNRNVTQLEKQLSNGIRFLSEISKMGAVSLYSNLGPAQTSEIVDAI